MFIDVALCRNIKCQVNSAVWIMDLGGAAYMRISPKVRAPWDCIVCFAFISVSFTSVWPYQATLQIRVSKSLFVFKTVGLQN